MFPVNRWRGHTIVARIFPSLASPLCQQPRLGAVLLRIVLETLPSYFPPQTILDRRLHGYFYGLGHFCQPFKSDYFFLVSETVSARHPFPALGVSTPQIPQ